MDLKNGSRSYNELFYRVDKDADGRITEEEVREVCKSIEYCFILLQIHKLPKYAVIKLTLIYNFCSISHDINYVVVEI